MHIPLKLSAMIAGINKAKQVEPFKGRLLALDPGHTTGWALYTDRSSVVHFMNQQDARIESGQVTTWPEADCLAGLKIVLDVAEPTLVVNESYRVYDWKTEDHAWSPVNTIQIIGCLWTLCIQRGIPRYEQSAQVAKAFWTDDRLKSCGVYVKGEPHGRDAMRHLLHYLCFGQKGS